MYLSTSEPRPHDTPCRRDSHSTWLLSWLALLLQGRCYDVLHWRHFPAAIVSVVLLNTAFQVHKETPSILRLPGCVSRQLLWYLYVLCRAGLASFSGSIRQLCPVANPALSLSR